MYAVQQVMSVYLIFKFWGVDPEMSEKGGEGRALELEESPLSKVNMAARMGRGGHIGHTMEVVAEGVSGLSESERCIGQQHQS